MSDNKIEEIRKRHLSGPLSNLLPMGDAAREEEVRTGWRTFCAEADADRAFLLAEVDRQRAEIEQLRAGIQSLAESLRASLDAAIRQRDEARAEIERLREALRWYADQRNHFPVEHRSFGDPDPAVIFVKEPPIMSDGGTRARSALEGKPQP